MGEGIRWKVEVSPKDPFGEDSPKDPFGEDRGKSIEERFAGWLTDKAVHR